MRAILLGMILMSGVAYADTYTVFGVSGTDSQREPNLLLGQDGCGLPECLNYAPGTFTGTALIDTSTDTVAGFTVNTGDSAFYEATWTPSQYDQNLGFGLYIDLPEYSSVNFVNQEPQLMLTFSLSNDSVSGMASGPSGTFPGEDQVPGAYNLNMVGTLTPGLTTVINTAPEIDPNSAGSAVALLVVGLLVLRGRRSRSQDLAL